MKTIHVKKSVVVAQSTPVNVTSYKEPRKNNICQSIICPIPKKMLWNSYVRMVMYLDDLEDQLEIVENGLFNDGIRLKVMILNSKSKHLVKLMNYQVRKLRTKIVWNQRDGRSKVRLNILLDGNGIIKDI